MGLFDYVKCNYPLPVKGANKHTYQTKDTPAQYMDSYEIREDGTLWHEDYDTEDRSDPKAEPGSIDSLSGMRTPVNHRWIQVPPFTGEIRFGCWKAEKSIDLNFSAYFVDGKVKQIHQIK